LRRDRRRTVVFGIAERVIVNHTPSPSIMAYWPCPVCSPHFPRNQGKARSAFGMRVGGRHKKRGGVRACPRVLFVSRFGPAPTAPTEPRLELRELRNMGAAMKPAAWVIGAVIVVAVLVRGLTRARKAHTGGSRPIAGVGTSTAA
jgi:hypothetical protein